MLKIINELEPFLEDCYRRISVREYSKIAKVSPPTASKLLKDYHGGGLLKKREERRHIFFYLNNESKEAIDLSRTYWRNKLDGLVKEIEEKLPNPAVVLFGSLSKAEARPDSDVDIVVFSSEKKIDVSRYEKQLKRKITIHWFRSLKEIKNEHLLNNILNGYVLSGRLRWG